MLLNTRSIGNHQSFKQVFSYSIFRGCGYIERMKIASREQLKASLRLSDRRLQIVEKNRLVRWRRFNAWNLFVRGQRANCTQ